MRIDFNGSFRQVSKLLDTSAQPGAVPKEPLGFSETLQAATEEGVGIVKNTGTPAEPSPAPELDLMARLSFKEPAIKPPPLTPFSGEILTPELVKEAPGSVKTPSVLEATRVQLAEDPKFTQRREKVAKLVNEIGKESGVDPALGMAVAQAESSFNPKAISTDGHASKGLFQLLDSTGKELHLQSGIEEQYDPFNPDQNVTLGIQYLRRLHEIFSDNTKLSSDLQSVTAANSASLEKLAVAAFNAGEGRVASAQARAKAAGFDPSMYDQVQSYLPKSTQEYVNRVMHFKSRFEGDDIG